MIRAWRGAATRRGPLLTLAATTGVVVAGTVTVLGFAERADASPRLAAPLLLLGLVAIPDTGRELGSARREEIGVARLHGLQGPGLLRLVAVEPALAVAAGTLGGCAVGALGIRATTGRWLDEATWWVGWWPVLVAVAIAAVAVVAVLLGMARAVREPLADQVSLAERPRSASTAGVFGSLLVIVLAVVAGYRAHTAGGQDPDWVVLVAPALVGLGAGQLAVWLLGAMGSVAVQAGRGQGLPTYLAVRRLRASAGIGHPLRLLVAAAVVAIVALAGAAQVSRWSDSTARLRVAGPVQVPFDGGAVAALQLTRTLDPEGRWLMAGAFVPGTGSGTDRRAYLDTARYPAVAGDFLAATPAAGLTPLLGSLRSDGADAGSDVEIATGRRLVMEVAGSPRGPGPGLVVEVEYVNDEGFLTSAAVVAPAPPAGESGATRKASTEVADCAHACVATTITVRVRGPGSTGSHLLVSRLDLGSTDLLSQPWVPSGSSGVTVTPAGLLVAGGRDGTLVPATAALAVVTTAGVAVPEAGTVKTPGGVVRPLDRVGGLEALPLVEGVGLLADLPRALAGDSPTVPISQVVVVASADTPPATLRALVEAAGGEPEPVGLVRDRVVSESGAQVSRVYALMALDSLLLAVLALLASTARRRPQRVEELAVLRLLGVPDRQVRRAGWRETGLLVTVAVLTSVAAGLAAARLLLPTLPLVRTGEYAVDLGAGIPVWVPVLTATLAAAVLLGAGARLAAVSAMATRPSTLREGVGG